MNKDDTDLGKLFNSHVRLVLAANGAASTGCSPFLTVLSVRCAQAGAAFNKRSYHPEISGGPKKAIPRDRSGTQVHLQIL